MGKIIDGIKQGIGIVLVLSIFVFGFYLVKGWNGLQATDGDTLTAAKWNELVGTANGSPSGAVIAFNLATCPTGRKPADGTNGTPDLRGQFLRGLNSFDGGATTRSDGKQDVDSRVLGAYQSDSMQEMIGSFLIANYGNPVLSGVFSSYSKLTSFNDAGVGGGGNLNGFKINFKASNDTNLRISSENRPKNVAIIYCIKE